MNKNWLIFWSLGFSCLTLPVFAGNKLANFLDTNGIDALKLHQAPYNLTGRKIAIGQVEIGRPGMFGWDKAVSKNRSVSPLAVFLRNAPAKSNIGVDPHAYNVSGVMVSQDKAFPGVAPNARLYSSAVGSVKKIGQPEECLSAQHIALQNGGDVRAINFSFGEPLDRDPRPEAILDGNALLTLCIDWSSSVHDVVYSIAGNQGKGGVPIPTDNFNAINVAFSSEQKGIFNKVHVSNLTSANQAIENRLAGKEFNLAGRSAISLVAPGTNLPLLNPDGKLNKSTGTSFAAPQVTATVALLQEFVDKQLRTKQPHWTINARRHQVMKAILLNSADKIKDSGEGLRLGMTRTLIDKQNLDWLATAAYKNAKIPLDAQMGAGHLNAFRAYQQLNGGEWKPTLTVPPIGWDYGIINTNSSQEYALEKSLKKNSFVAITLSWDRLVELNDKNNNQQYDLDETFVNKGLNDLDVYLVQENGKNDQVVVCASMSELDSIEHIFCPVPTHGNYKIRVQFKKQINKPTQSYALAWWTVPER
ncbi:S8 family serine peptidase [Aphanizomenon flos-aquae NRERC-008]|uniref:S8 family serine peptidase n=1 Tax=Aphanizomenon flos-aquae FACHB-1249 TaxID=2692889 RepID=A0ABR8ITA6_APHFL|nr:MULTISPECIES: S8 family serine peptidase [Aphanizomenon]MBD2631399.1 S8 family serine peptidase [Aphanizomenon sp. FACHB-1399]MBD2642495.1 S8 family serine peptidase [Aphanizomenon sp. FACHB-1401]MBD2685463.1 S8 family serine peptidase [Aphanizomenon flos-aquae FACHB-1249]MDS9397762.1 S8 family serine peptidase [Aphanizomenon flos-aquae NRERC-008]